MKNEKMKMKKKKIRKKCRRPGTPLRNMINIFCFDTVNGHSKGVILSNEVVIRNPREERASRI
jgi:hypothetical protein